MPPEPAGWKPTLPDARALHRGQRSSAMAHPVLHVFPQFSEGLFKPFRHKKRIVTEAALAAGRKPDAPFTRRFEQLRWQFEFVGHADRRRALLRHRTARGERQHAAKARGAFFPRNRLEQT